MLLADSSTLPTHTQPALTIMPDTPPNNMVQLAWQFKADALARETAASSALVQAWGGAWHRLAQDLAALTDTINTRTAAGQAVTHGMIWREERYRALLRQIDREMADLLPF